MEISEAITEFRQAAIAKGDFAVPAPRDHQLHAVMERAWRFLTSQGGAGREAFEELLNDESPHVRSWVAAQLLSEGDERAVAALEAIAKANSRRSTGFNAEMTLSEWREGRLRSPFGNKER